MASARLSAPAPRLERRDGGAGSFATVGSAAANAGALNDATTVANTSYEYRVKACLPGGCSAVSNVITLGTTPSPLASIGLTLGTCTNTCAVTVGFTDNGRTENHWEVQRAANAAFTLNLTNLANINSATETATGPAISRQYLAQPKNVTLHYRVRACRTTNVSGTVCSAYVSGSIET